MDTHRTVASCMAVVSVQKLGSGRDILDRWLQLSATAADMRPWMFFKLHFHNCLQDRDVPEFRSLTLRNLLLIFGLVTPSKCTLLFLMPSLPLLKSLCCPTAIYGDEASTSQRIKSFYKVLTLLMMKLFALFIAELQWLAYIFYINLFYWDIRLAWHSLLLLNRLHFFVFLSLWW